MTGLYQKATANTRFAKRDTLFKKVARAIEDRPRVYIVIMRKSEFSK